MIALQKLAIERIRTLSREVNSSLADVGVSITKGEPLNSERSITPLQGKLAEIDNWIDGIMEVNE